jgi:hypothetical protein
MKFTRKSLLGLAGVGIASVLLTLAAPKAAHAVTATLVQVANTRATPVPTESVDEPGRHPYQTTCTGFSNAYGLAYCNTPNVPAGYEFVIQSVSMYVQNAAPQYAYIITTVSNGVMDTYIPLTAQGGLNYVGAVGLTLQNDPNNGITCDAVTSSTEAGVTCSFSGYLTSLP